VAWTVYPHVDLISAWKLKNMVLTGRVPEVLLQRGGRLEGAGTIVALKVELHPLGTHKDDRLAAPMMPGQMSGPIQENGHYKLIRLDRRVPGGEDVGDGRPTVKELHEIPAPDEDDLRIYFGLVEKLGNREGWE
jgi:hypothetical protein